MSSLFSVTLMVKEYALISPSAALGAEEAETNTAGYTDVKRGCEINIEYYIFKGERQGEIAKKSTK